jgi:hypothetical protein
MAGETESFLDAAKRAFAHELETRTLTIVEHRRYEAFGDEGVVLEGPGFRLKVSRDRGQTYALVAALREPEDWHRLQAVVSAVRSSDVPGAVEPVGWELSVTEAASLYRQHELELSRMYRSWWGWRSLRKRLNALRKVQREQLDAWLAAPKSDDQRRLDEAADRALEHPSDELKAALKALDLDK